MDDVKEEIKKFNLNSLTWPIAVFLLVLALLFPLLLSIISGYSKTIVTERRDNYMTIVRDISISIENEVSQTEQALQFFVRTNDFSDALSKFVKEDSPWPLNRVSLSFCVYYSQVIDNMIIASGDDLQSQLWSLKRKKYDRLALVSSNQFATMYVFANSKDPNDAYLGITVTDVDGYHITAMLSLALMYERLASHIKFSENIDMLIKNSDGLIVMSSITNFIGRDVDSLLAERNDKTNYEQAQEIIQKQKAKQAGSEVTDARLFDSETAKPVRKLSVYVPAQLDSGFWIVSAVIDFQAVTAAANDAISKITGLVSFIFLAIFVLLEYILIATRHKQEVEKENKYLKELNKTLQLVNENEKMKNHEQRLEMIGTMTYGIAHEFNNLLTPIMGYSGMLLSQKNPDDSEYEDIKEIFDASEKAKDIIQQISAFGRKNEDMTFHSIQIFQFLSQVQKLANGLMPSLVQFSIIPAANDGYFFGNTTQLTQVVINLIVNAIDAIGNGEGHIVLSYRNLEHEELKNTPEFYEKNIEYGCIEISDDGCGMSEETVEKLFQPFFTTKTNNGGNGLGLLISQNIIKAHHGMISVTTKVGKGSVFSIILPRSEKRAEVKATEIESLKMADTVSLNILAVDDDMKVLKFYSKGLGRLGHGVTKLSDSTDAWQVIKRHRYDVLILDDSMKGLSGLDLALKARQKWPALTIILVSGTIRKETIDALRSNLINGYLLKPVTMNELIDMIDDVYNS